MTLRCTATVYRRGGVSRCLSEHIVRDFCSSLFPDGPAIRLCQQHTDAFHRVATNAICQGEGSLPMESLEEIADQWRWTPECR